MHGAEERSQTKKKYGCPACDLFVILKEKTLHEEKGLKYRREQRKKPAAQH